MNASEFARMVESNRKKVLFGQNLKISKAQKDDYLRCCHDMIMRIYDGRESITYEEWMDFRN